MYDQTSPDILNYHHSMLEDKDRTRSFLRAILRTVKPGDVVLDIGSGTGVLSYFACMAGAKQVYAVEQSPIIELAQTICKRNGFQDRVKFINDWSTNVDLPEPVDVIITETIGNLGFEEGILGWIIDAKRRLLADGGRIIPRAIELVIAPVEHPEYIDHLNSWSHDFYSLDLSPARTLVVNSLFSTEISPLSLLSEPTTLVSLDLTEIESADFNGKVSFTAKRDGSLNGLGGWFSAEIAQGITISNTPPLKTPCWQQVFFPIEQPVQISAGDTLSVEMQVRNNAGQWDWQITANSPTKGKSFTQESIRFSYKSQAGSLQTPWHLGSQDTFLVRTEEAEVDLFILQLMDGATTPKEIARQTTAEFPGQFANIESALSYVYIMSEDYARWAKEGDASL